MNGIYMIIGGNMGNREEYLNRALIEIDRKIGTLQKLSSLYETDSWGNTEQEPFLNQVLFVKTKMNAEEVLRQCLEIEKLMGRKREQKWASRIIDIDILFFNDEIISSDHLKIPHPHIADRKFVLAPLAEIAPDFVHPVSGKTISDMLALCKDSLEVKKINGY